MSGETRSHVGPRELEALVADAGRRRETLLAQLAGRRAELPLRYWSQAAHFTTPAGDESMARKAISGTAPVGRIMARFGVSAVELAERLGLPAAAVEAALANPRPAPMVMLDGEDAQALRDDVLDAGLDAAVSVLRDEEAIAAAGSPRPLRFYRPPGSGLERGARDLLAVLLGAGRGLPPERYPIDGIVFPKIEHPEEVDWLYETLEAAEQRLGLSNGRIRVAFLIESGWGAARLPEIALRAAPRLCALIFGIADYSADLGLPSISNEHPLADWARAEIVNTAGAVGVPAIDAMTLEFPVADPALDIAANRARFLDRMALVHGDAVRAREIGMLGKWVGHPAQLLAVLLAFEAGGAAESLEDEAAKLEAYRASVEDEAKGATMIGGVMSDRATDRHAREVLRRAVAAGRFDAGRARRLGIISAAEEAEMESRR